MLKRTCHDQVHLSFCSTVLNTGCRSYRSTHLKFLFSSLGCLVVPGVPCHTASMGCLFMPLCSSRYLHMLKRNRNVRCNALRIIGDHDAPWLHHLFLVVGCALSVPWLTSHSPVQKFWKKFLCLCLISIAHTLLVAGKLQPTPLSHHKCIQLKTCAVHITLQLIPPALYTHAYRACYTSCMPCPAAPASLVLLAHSLWTSVHTVPCSFCLTLTAATQLVDFRTYAVPCSSRPTPCTLQSVWA